MEELIENIEIENPNLELYTCSPELNVSGSVSGFKDIVEITLIEDGYIKADSIITVKFNESLLDSDSLYPFLTQSSYKFFNGSYYNPFYIESALESSGFTKIKLYGKTKDLEKFFGVLEIKSLTGYKVNFFENLQISDNEICKTLGFTLNGITKDSVIVITKENKNKFKGLIISYREVDSENWIKINTQETFFKINNLDQDTEYEVRYCVKCSDFSYSFNSSILKFKTFKD
jgi:hypothetical protein